jgi:hypothetical protein
VDRQYARPQAAPLGVEPERSFDGVDAVTKGEEIHHVAS